MSAPTEPPYNPTQMDTQPQYEAPLQTPKAKNWWLIGCLGCLGTLMVIGILIAAVAGIGAWWFAKTQTEAKEKLLGKTVPAWSQMTLCMDEPKIPLLGCMLMGADKNKTQPGEKDVARVAIVAQSKKPAGFFKKFFSGQPAQIVGAIKLLDTKALSAAGKNKLMLSEDTQVEVVGISLLALSATEQYPAYHLKTTDTQDGDVHSMLLTVLDTQGPQQIWVMVMGGEASDPKAYTQLEAPLTELITTTALLGKHVPYASVAQ